MDESMEKFSKSAAFLSSTSIPAEPDSINDSPGTRAMTITDGRFFKLVPEKCVFNTTVALCTKCEPNHVEVKGNVNSSSNFICHLKRRHGFEAVEEYNEYLRTKKRYKRQCTDTAMLSRQFKVKIRDPIAKNVMKFLLHSMVPVKAVTNPYFLTIFRDLNVPEDDLKCLTYQHITTKLEKTYQNAVEQLRKDLGAASHVFCTCNIWSGQDSSFLSITAHWLSEDLIRKSAVLGFRRVTSETGLERVAAMINDIQRKFGVEQAEISTIVGGYNFSFLKAFNEYGVQSCSVDCPPKEDEENDSTDSEVDLICLKNQVIISLKNQLCFPNHVKCALQTLQNCASVEIARAISASRFPNFHSSIMRKLNLLWSHPESARAIKEITGLTLSRPSFNCWASIYSSLQEILTIKDKCVEIFQALECKDYLQNYEFTYLEEHLMYTKPFADALAILRGEEHTFLGSLLPTLLALRRKLTKLTQREWTYCQSLVVECLKIVNEKFYDFYNFTTQEAVTASVAAFSHPNFKNRWISCVDSKYHDHILKAFHTAVAAEMTTREEVSVPVCHEFFDFGSENEDLPAASSKSPEEVQVFNFFNHPVRSPDIWANFPDIKKVFIKYNTPLSSFGIVEQMFGENTLYDVLTAPNALGKAIEMRIFLKVLQ